MTLESGKPPVWFITGCSKGLGRAIAEYVLAQGHRCVATARDVASLHPLRTADACSRAMVLSLDVTRPEQIAQAVARAYTEFGGIDVLVNNAGFGYNASVEQAEEPRIRALFETNFFGLSTLTRAVLPHMRRNRKGHIFNISSISGRVASPGTAYYAASKFAVEGLSQGLAQELAPLGIRVTAVEPGPLRTDFQGGSMTWTEHLPHDYADTVGERHARLRASHGKQAGDPVRAAQAIFHAFMSDAPPLQMVLGERAYDMMCTSLLNQLAELERQRDIARSIDYRPL